MDSKTSSPEGIIVAAATPNRIENTPLPAPLPPHVPCLWVQVAEGEGFVRATDAALTCPVCGARAEADEKTIAPEESDYNGWMQGLVGVRCTADTSHDCEEVPFRREIVAVVSKAVMDAAVDTALSGTEPGEGDEIVLCRSWADPRVRIGRAGDLGREDIRLAFLVHSEGRLDVFNRAVWMLSRDDRPLSRAVLREVVRDAIVQSVEEDDLMGLSCTAIVEGEPDHPYGAWAAVMDEADAQTPQQFRVRSHCDAWAVCPECNDKKGVFVEDAEGNRVCAKCGFDFDSVADDESQWTEDEIDSERIPVTAGNADMEVS